MPSMLPDVNNQTVRREMQAENIKKTKVVLRRQLQIPTYLAKMVG